MITFNKAPFIGTEFNYIQQAVDNLKICGDGSFTAKCREWMEERFGTRCALLTTSGTSALELSAALCKLEPGDEVILPSFTFSSTATAFVGQGARLKFVDVRPDTMNMDEKLIEAAITPKTRVIAPVHYAGVSCEMDTILDIAAEHKLKVVEDAAQGVMSTYKGKALGTLGDFGCFSFHETKNYSMGEGGALLIRDEEPIETAEIYREKGTNRARFFRGQVDKYTWVDWGSSFLPSDMLAAYLWAQLEQADAINEDRLATWRFYRQAFEPLAASERIELQTIPAECVHNAHMFYIKCRDLADRTAFINHMRERGVQCVFHYVPLHSAPAGMRFGEFVGVDRYTTSESDRLVRLPMYYGMSDEDRATVVEAALDYLARR
ncbi:MAG: dTDP-4-amino-4,6-dideoxygalactose transaminase [Coriobacteriales bacterium]|nr:dTDP-4-amino-4,6-dideoxygalactose transaminase [Coriobacteriales bacterium]